MRWEILKSLWCAFYLFFNNSNDEHCENRFWNILIATEEDGYSEEWLEKKNYEWIRVIRDRKVTDEDIKEVEEDMLKYIKDDVGRELTLEETAYIQRILWAKNKLRLLLFEECNRNCKGCCNQEFSLESLPVCRDYTPYTLIMLTGGEPMLRPEFVLRVVERIRESTNAPIILYTAWAKDKKALAKVLDHIDGMTLTLHSSEDIRDFQEFDKYYPVEKKQKKMLRLNVFAEVGKVEASSSWQVKNEIQWIKNCPLPEGEVFMRYEEKVSGDCE